MDKLEKGCLILGPGCHAKEFKFYLVDDQLPLKTLKWGDFYTTELGGDKFEEGSEKESSE